jgi:hypothetical protein
MSLRRLGVSPMFRRGGEVIDPDAQLYFDELTGTVPQSYKSAINWGVTYAKNNNLWDKIDRLFWKATPNEQNATISVVNPTSTPSTTNAGITYISGLGHKANGTTGYVDSNFAPDDGVNYTQDDAGVTCLIIEKKQSVTRSMVVSWDTVGGYANALYHSTAPDKIYYAANSPTYYGYASTGPRVNGIHSVVRVDDSNIVGYLDSVVTLNQASASVARTSLDFYELAGNFNGAPDDYSENTIVCSVYHSGDINVSNLYTMLTGIAAKLSGNVVMEPLNESIAGMSAGDSVTVVNYGSGKLGMFFGWVFPGGAGDYQANWWKSLDGGATWAVQGALPYKSGHVNYGLREDGLVWFWGIDADSGSPTYEQQFVVTFDPVLETFDNISIQSLAGEDAQWGFYLDTTDELFQARYIGVGDTDLYKTSDGTTWTKACDLPDSINAFRSSAYVRNGVIRFCGGGRYNGSTETVDLVSGIYESTDGINWTTDEDLPLMLRSFWPTFFYYNGKEFLIRGYTNLGYTGNDGHVYAKTGSAWADCLMWHLTTRHAVGVCEYNGDIICMQGYYFADCYKITPFTP